MPTVDPSHADRVLQCLKEVAEPRALRRRQLKAPNEVTPTTPPVAIAFICSSVTVRPTNFRMPACVTTTGCSLASIAP